MREIWKDISRIASSDCNVLKFVFRNENAVGEAVLYKYPTYEERTVVCCSTQSGCPIGCRFCGAGDFFVRSLTAEEIVVQTAYMFEKEGVDPSKVQRMQIMFMSMGEPMLNFKNVAEAIRRLHVLYPQAALLISTSGPDVGDQVWDSLIELSVEIPKVGLQFSVHESTDEARSALIPFKKKLTLRGIQHVGEKWWIATGRSPFFNYCAHEKNTAIIDSDNLFSLFHPAVWEATISVICERDESIAAANARQQKLAFDFQQRLASYGYSTRMFNPAGQDDIGGGCGQLWFVQDWMKEHPELARPSVGNGLPAVHTPT